MQDACLAQLHLFTLKQICQLEWASSQLKPKQTQSRFNTLLMQQALDSVDKASVDELNYIMQGFRNKQNKGIYQKVRKTLVDRKKELFTETEHKHHDMINLLY